MTLLAIQATVIPLRCRHSDFSRDSREFRRLVFNSAIRFERQPLHGSRPWSNAALAREVWLAPITSRAPDMLPCNALVGIGGRVSATPIDDDRPNAVRVQRRWRGRPLRLLQYHPVRKQVLSTCMHTYVQFLLRMVMRNCILCLEPHGSTRVTVPLPEGYGLPRLTFPPRFQNAATLLRGGH
jgi:hypothetical protein